MKNEDILKARKKYKKLENEKEQLLILKKEFLELKNNDMVKRYLELKEIINKELLQESQIVRYSFGLVNTKDIESEEKIYIYMGAYKYDNAFDSRNDILIDEKDSEFADYLLYMNIDTDFDSVSIKPNQKELFEKKHTVLKFKSTFNINKKYYDLQQYYFKELLEIDLRKKNKILTMLKNKINL